MRFILLRPVMKEAPVFQYLLKLHFRTRVSLAELRLLPLLMVLDLMKYNRRCTGAQPQSRG